MGLIWSKFKKKQKIEDELAGLCKAIASMEKNKEDHERSERKLVGFIFVYSVLLLFVTAIVLFFYYFPRVGWTERVLCAVPLMLCPVLIYALQKAVHWYFRRKITHSERHLEALKTRKRELFERIMEEETYKRARELIEKFEPDLIYADLKEQQLNVSSSTNVGLSSRQTVNAAVVSGVDGDKRSRAATLNVPSVATSSATPVRTGNELSQRNLVQSPAETTLKSPERVQPVLRPIPLPREVLPREVSLVERLMEYLVGDGVSQRFALICTKCKSHNGMALREEFAHIEFRCAYCYHLNPARKQRPMAPRLTKLADVTAASPAVAGSSRTNSLNSSNRPSPSRQSAGLSVSLASSAVTGSEAIRRRAHSETENGGVVTAATGAGTDRSTSSDRSTTEEMDDVSDSASSAADKKND